MVILVPDTTRLPMSIGRLARIRNGLNTDTPTIAAIASSTTPGTARRRMRTSRL